MDFHSLNRRELQALCKLNKIPANTTNIAMADALKSIETKVEGIEEILNPSRSESAGSSIESPEKNEVTSPRAPRTSCRTSTRQKVKKTETESVPATASRMTGRGVRRQLAGEVNELKTPMVTSTRKKVPTTSCRNVGFQLNECEEVFVENETKCIPNTPVAGATYSRRKGTTASNQDTMKKEATVQRVYSTRRSTRLTAKKSEEPGVIERERSEPVKIDSFLDEVSAASEEDLGHPVQEKNVGSDSGSLEISHESNTSSENTEDKVGEGSVENYYVADSKEKVEDICNAFEKLDVLVGDGSDQNLEIKKAQQMDAPLETGEEKVDCSGELVNNIEVQSVKILEQDANMDSEETQNGELDSNIEGQSVEVHEQGANMDSKETQIGELDSNIEGQSVEVLVQDAHMDSEETQNDGRKLVLNEVDNSEEKDSQVDNLKADAVLVPEEDCDSILSDKPSLLSEADDVDADSISSDTENSSDLSTTELEDTSSAGSETDNEVPESKVDFLNPKEQESDMDFEASAEKPQVTLIQETAIEVMPTICEEPQMSLIEKTAIDVMPTICEERQMSLIEKTAIDVMPTMCKEPVLNSEQLNQEAEPPMDDADNMPLETAVDEAEQTMDDADNMPLETVVDDSFIKEENQFPSKATTDAIDHSTSISEMTSDNNENNNGLAVPVVAVEENKNVNEIVEDEKPKSSIEMSLRQLKKQLKALSIKSNTNNENDDKMGEARPALQAVCDNQLVNEDMET